MKQPTAPNSVPSQTHPQTFSLLLQDDVTSVAATGHKIVGGSVDGTLRRFDIRVGRAYCDDVRHPVTSAVFTGDGLCLLAACLDSTLRLIDKATGAGLGHGQGGLGHG